MDIEQPSKVGHIIQITNPDHHWFASLLVVEEEKSWGVMAYVHIPANDGTSGGDAYIRVENKDYEIVGKAIIVHDKGTEK